MSDDQVEQESVANDFFDAITRGDFVRVKELYSPEVKIWHNTTNRTQNRAENLELLNLFTSKLTGLRYEVHCRDFFAGGFVQRHTLHGQALSGEPIAALVCIIIHVADGHIQRIYEYLDASDVAAAFTSG